MSLLWHNVICLNIFRLARSRRESNPRSSPWQGDVITATLRDLVSWCSWFWKRIVKIRISAMRRLVNECLRPCAVQRFSRYNRYRFWTVFSLGSCFSLFPILWVNASFNGINLQCRTQDATKNVLLQPLCACVIGLGLNVSLSCWCCATNVIEVSFSSSPFYGRSSRDMSKT